MSAKRSQSVRKIVRKASAEGRTCRRVHRIQNRRETQNCRHFLRFALQENHKSQGSGGSWSRSPELSSLLDSSRLFASQKCQQSQGSGGVVVAKPRTVVTFGLVSCLRVSKVSSHRDGGGGRGREAQNCRHFWTCLVSSRLKSVNSHRNPGGRGRETQNCRHFWTRLGCPCLKSVNSHRDRGGRGRETQNCRHFWTCLECLGGRGRETQNCRHFWTPLVSSRLKSVNSHRDRGGSWSRNPELSSLLDSSRLFASQKCQQSQGSGGVVVAKPRTVVTFGLADGERKGERREEKREMRGEKRGEREETGERRGEERG